MPGSGTAGSRRSSRRSWRRSRSRWSSRGRRHGRQRARRGSHHEPAVNTSERRGALLFVATVAGIAAVVAANTALLLWAVSIAVIAGGLAAWSRLAWKQVEVSAKFRPARAFLSEQVTLRVRFT